MYSCTEGQFTSTLRLLLRPYWTPVSAKHDARPRPRSLLGTSVWISPSTFPVILYSREAICPSRSISKRPVVTFCGVCDLGPTIPHTIIGFPRVRNINITNNMRLQCCSFLYPQGHFTFQLQTRTWRCWPAHF